MERTTGKQPEEFRVQSRCHREQIDAVESNVVHHLSDFCAVSRVLTSSLKFAKIQ